MGIRIARDLDLGRDFIIEPGVITRRFERNGKIPVCWQREHSTDARGSSLSYLSRFPPIGARRSFASSLAATPPTAAPSGGRRSRP
jgi:hypothetical protein